MLREHAEKDRVTINLVQLSHDIAAPAPLAPPISQVEELKPNTHRNKLYSNLSILLYDPSRQSKWCDGAPTKASTGRPPGNTVKGVDTKILTKSRKVKSRISAKDRARRQQTPFEHKRVKEKTSHSQENRERNLFTKEREDNLKDIDPSIIAMAADVSRLNKLFCRILDPDLPSNE